jgi:hypothetical protein
MERCLSGGNMNKLPEPIKELNMTYKKLLKEAKKHIRTRIIDYKPASSIHIAGINDDSQIPNAIICWLKDGSQVVYISNAKEET